MVIEIVERREISDYWFLDGQQYDYTETSMRTVDSCTSCGTAIYPSLRLLHYHIVIDGTTYYVPENIAAKVDGATSADTDLSTREEKYLDEMTTDAYVTDGDYVGAAKRLFDINIGAKTGPDQADYADQERLEEMKREAYQNVEGREINRTGINET